MRDESTFWGRLRPEEECWVYTGYKNFFGYGEANWLGRTIMAHRLAWLLVYGGFTPGLRVCHSCDRPDCANPAHLFEGTAADNTADMVAKGRARGGVRGPDNGRAVLTPELVRGLRLAHAGGASRYSLMRVYGVSKTQVARILRGESW